MYIRLLAIVTLSLAAACGGSDPRANDPTAPPVEARVPSSVGKADGTCQYHCATYHYAANQCYEGWQCDATGVCLTYVGTPDAPTACPSPPPPPPPPCIPTTCAAQKATCGSIPDSCGGTLACGSCGGADTCGGGGTSNVCGHVMSPSDPFDPASCQGPAFTQSDAIKYLGVGGTAAPIGNYSVNTRVRTCSTITGCGAWVTDDSVLRSWYSPNFVDRASWRSVETSGTLSLVTDPRSSWSLGLYLQPNATVSFGYNRLDCPVFPSGACDREDGQQTAEVFDAASNVYGGISFSGFMGEHCFRAAAAANDRYIQTGEIYHEAESVIFATF